MIDKNIIEEIKNLEMINILEREGYYFKKEGKYYRCIEHSSLIVKESSNKKNFYWNSKNINGDLIDFIRNDKNYNFKESVEYLKKYIYLDENNIKSTKNECKNSKKAIESNEKFDNFNIEYMDNCNRAIAYLNKTRGINYNIIKEFTNKGLIGQDSNGNIVFKYLNETNITVGADLIGTLTYKKFRGIVKESNENYGFSLKIGTNSTKIMVFESCIDLISFYQLYKGKGLKDTLLLSISGCEKINKINTYLTKDIKEIIVSVDNDIAGINCLNAIKEKYSNLEVIENREILIKENVKDWNELLLKRNKI